MHSDDGELEESDDDDHASDPAQIDVNLMPQVRKHGHARCCVLPTAAGILLHWRATALFPDTSLLSSCRVGVPAAAARLCMLSCAG